VNTGVEWKPAANISLSFGPGLERNLETAQWMNVFDDQLASATYGRRYVFANMDQTTLSGSTRLNWTFTPKLSLQLYMQPLISTGDYRDFKELARAKSFDFNRYGDGASTIDFENGTYVADPDGDGPAPAISFDNPDFSIKSLRGNAVLRWEYLPGSTLYFVWTQSRSDYEKRRALIQSWRRPALRYETRQYFSGESHVLVGVVSGGRGAGGSGLRVWRKELP
jgi:hypothetical protein